MCVTRGGARGTATNGSGEGDEPCIYSSGQTDGRTDERAENGKDPGFRRERKRGRAPPLRVGLGLAGWPHGSAFTTGRKDNERSPSWVAYCTVRETFLFFPPSLSLSVSGVPAGRPHRSVAPRGGLLRVDTCSDVVFGVDGRSVARGWSRTWEGGSGGCGKT